MSAGPRSRAAGLVIAFCVIGYGAKPLHAQSHSTRTPTWTRLWELPASDRLLLDQSVLITRDTDATFDLVSLTDGRSVAHGQAPSQGFEQLVALQGSVVVGLVSGPGETRAEVFGFDLSSSTRWSKTIGRPNPAHQCHSCLATIQDRVIVVSRNDASFEVFALDAVGHEHWRRSLASVLGGAPVLVAVGTHLYVHQNSRVWALDPSDGAILWTFDAAPGGAHLHIVHFVADENRVVVDLDDSNGRRVRKVLDAATGHEHSSSQPADNADSIVLSDATILSISNEGVTARELYSDRMLWRHRAHPARFMDFFASDTIVAFCTEGGTLRVLDRATGARRMDWGLGECSIRGIVENGETLAVIAHDHDHVVAFGSGQNATPLRRITVHGIVRVDGHPRGRVRIAVGDQQVLTSGVGAFNATVRARGHLRVAFEGPERENECLVGDLVHDVTLDRANRYAVTFDLRAGVEVPGDCVVRERTDARGE